MKSWPNDWVPFHWSRPEKKRGYYDDRDLVGPREPPLDELRPKYRCSDKLINLDVNNPIRRVFSSDHARNRDKTNETIQELIREIGLVHEVDFANSLEAKIINLTIKYRGLVEEVKRTGDDNRFRGSLRIVTNSVKYRRLRYLCDLKEQHEDRYKRIIEKLKIDPVDNKINVPYERPYRKIQMRRLALEYAQNLKEEKVENYLKSLEEEKQKFEIEKQETLKWIKEQEEKLGITVD